MARIPNLNSPHDDSALNIHNEVIDQMNSHLKKYNDLAEDTQQLISETEEYLSDATEDQKDKYKALYERADYLQDNAQAIYEMNQDVQQMLDNIVLESGTSDAELVQARGDYDLLKDRLNYYDDEVEQVQQNLDGTLSDVNENLNQFKSNIDDDLEQTKENVTNQLNDLGTTEFIRSDDYTLISVERPTSSIDINYDSNDNVEMIEETGDDLNIRTTLNRNNDRLIESYNREEF